MNAAEPFPAASGNAGFALVEVLITVVIVSVGLLALAKLQGFGIRSAGSSLQRTVASFKAYEISDRMRANQVGVGLGHYNSLSGTGTDPACVTTSAGCTTAQIAQNDYYEWSSDLARALPGGRGAVCLDSTIADGTPGAPACDGLGTAYAIKVWWDDDRSGNLARFITAFRP